MATQDNNTRYIEAVGRRKTSTARVRITPSEKQIVSINGKVPEEYFPTQTLSAHVSEPFHVEGVTQTFVVTVKVIGGGISSQSEAVRHGIARALSAFEISLRKPLKSEGFLTRDPRMK
jgi:small subunit ribosomal protein S9